MPKVTLYHGTARDFAAFAEPGSGHEPNSALGIHLTECPAVAAEYALTAGRDRNAGRPRVLVVEAEVSRVAVTSLRSQYLGTCPATGEQVATRADFAALRDELARQGFDAATTDCEHEDLLGCHAVFDPAGLTIVGEIATEAAMEMDGAPCDGPLYECAERTFALILGEEEP